MQEKRINGAQTSAFHIEADKIGRKISVSIGGVRAVCEFSEEYILLKLSRGKIKISGTGLSISVYENNIVEVLGGVRGIELL